MKGLWSDEDELAFRRVRAEYERLLARRTGGAGGPLSTFSHVSAATLYRARRLRDIRFAEAGRPFGEPAWDILLDLFSAWERHRSVTVSSACIGAGAPNSTALRHIRRLEAMGLLERADHPGDRRTQIVSMTPRAIRLMRGYLEAIGG